MGTAVGHIAPGFAFLLLGLWHLFNHIKLHALNHPKPYTSPPWFPTSKSKYIELYLIMASCTASFSMELFIGPDRHQPFDPDGTIPTNHLHNLEHSLISMTFFVYAAFAIILDKLLLHTQKTQYGLTQLLAATAFAQQFLLFHLHSADHMGPEGQYHLLLQLVIFVSLITTLMGIGMQKSFLVSFLRSLSILFQGVWLVLMGFTLWTPRLIPKGCFLHPEEGHKVVRCSDEESLYRAKSLINIQFSWFFVLVASFGVCFYLVLVKFYGENKKVEYFSLEEEEQEEDQEQEDDDDNSNDDVEAQKKSSTLDNPMMSLIHVGKTFSSVDIER